MGRSRIEERQDHHSSHDPAHYRTGYDPEVGSLLDRVEVASGRAEPCPPVLGDMDDGRAVGGFGVVGGIVMMR